METESIYKSGKWQVFKILNIDPEEFMITNTYRTYYNRSEDVAKKFAEWLDSINREDLQEA